MLIMVIVFACSSEPDRFTLTVEKVGEGEITITPQNDFYKKGAKVTIKAVPSDGWKFKEWSGDESGTTDLIEVTMDKNKTITAEFVKEEVKYTLTTNVSPTGAGTIEIDPPTGPYKEGSSVIVTAVPSNHYVFDSWSGDLSGVTTSTTTFAIYEDKNITATFIEYATLTINTEGIGSVAVDPEKDVYYAKGDVVTLRAVPVLNTSVFTKWEGGTIDNSTNLTETITLNSDTTVKAIFGLSDKVSSYEDFEQNDGTWSTKYTYELSPTDSTNKKPFVQQTTVYSGDWSAQFGDVGNNEYSCFKTDVSLTHDSCVSFLYKVSSEKDHGKFLFIVDSNDLADAELVKSGEVYWTTYERELTAGNHTLLWVYAKDETSGGGKDTAWVDDIVIRDVVPKHKLTINTTGYGKVLKKVYGEHSYLEQYEEGAPITLKAIPGSGESFTTWSGADAPVGHLTDSTIEITMGTSDITIDASFTGTAPVIKWLIMMYIGGDCGLEENLWSDLNEMEFGLHKLNEDVRSKIRVVALWDGIEGYSDASPEGTRLYELGTDTELNASVSSATKDLTADKWWRGNEADMSDGAMVTGFLNWAKSNYPGYEHSMLIMSDHGGGPRNRYGKPQKGAIWDETSGGVEYFFLETKEISQAISDAGFTEDDKLSLFGFDACLMGSAEEAYEHRTVAEYYVASLQVEQGYGWEHHHWVPQIMEEMSPADLGTVLVESYRENFAGGLYADQTLSCTDLSKMDDLKTAIDALGKAIKDKNVSADCKAKFEASTSFGGKWGTLHEVGDFANRLSSTAVSTEANAVADAMKSAIVYSWADFSTGNYYGAGSTTGRGLHLVGEMKKDKRFNYDTTILSFADGDWAALYNEWYP